MIESFFDNIPFANDLFDVNNSSSEDTTKASFSVEETDENPHKKQKISSTKHSYYTPSLRVLKSDIRRSYMTMYFNVMNSSNPQLMRSYFNQYYRPNCQWIVNFTNNFYPNRIYSYGGENITASFCDFFERIPDFLMKSSDVNLYVSYDTSKSHIVCKCKVSGTKMFNISTEQLLPYNATNFPTAVEYISYVSSYQLPPETPTTTTSTPSITTIYKKKLYQPTIFSLEGTFTMILDENYQIHSMETIFTNCQEMFISSIGSKSLL